jgi:hypothetical protein
MSADKTLLEAVRELQATAPAPTVEDNSQNWAALDGAVAWHLIERHADNWADVAKMMDEWLAAKLAPASARIAELERQLAAMTVDRDSWAEQASQRLADWDAMRQRAESAEQQLEQARKDADRWRAMRQTFVAVDWAWNSPPIPVAIFELHANTVRGGPSGADEVADAAIASRGSAQEQPK